MTWNEIVTWATVFGTKLGPFDVKAIRSIDRAFLNNVYEQHQKQLQRMRAKNT